MPFKNRKNYNLRMQASLNDSRNKINLSEPQLSHQQMGVYTIPTLFLRVIKKLK